MKKIFRWIFKEELDSLQKQIDKSKQIRQEFDYIKKKYEEKEKKFDNLFKNIDVSVDVHHYAPSWAVISIQGQKQDYIKFINLGQADLLEIKRFLSHFDRDKVDCAPNETQFLRIDRQNYNFK